jgi:hypothetical protein
VNGHRITRNPYVGGPAYRSDRLKSVFQPSCGVDRDNANWPFVRQTG